MSLAEKKGCRTVLILFVLLIPICVFVSGIKVISAQETIEQVNTPEPIIKVTFDKEVVSYEAHLYNVRDPSDFELQFTEVSISENKKVFRFKAIGLLEEGLYRFVIKGTDTIGNVGEQKEHLFEVNISTINITLVSPPFGVTSLPAVNLSFETNRDAVLCKYFFIGQHNFDEVLPELVKEDARRHIIPDFAPSVEGTPVNIICNDSYGYINDYAHGDEPKTFIIYYDPTGPIITQAYSDPQQVLDESSVTFKAVTDDDTICKFDDQETNYTYMHNEFPGAADYYFTQSHDYVKSVVGMADLQAYSYYAACVNKAEQVSETANITFSINRNAAEQISATPTGSTTNRTINFEAITNKVATCKIIVPDIISAAQMPSAPNKKNHYYNYQFNADGSYDYTINCTFDLSFNKKSITQNFVIDTTPAYMLFVNSTNPQSSDPRYTCSDNLYAVWDAEDNLTGIAGYNYSVVTSQNIILLPMTWTTEKSVVLSGADLNISEGTSYMFNVYAVNSLGLLGAIKSSETITVNNDYCPSISTCTDNKRNGNETDIDCGGNCPKCAIDEKCSLNSDCTTDICSDGICAAPLCSNHVKDETETDIDCGGPCPRCIAGKECKTDLDCKSNSCIDFICAEEISCSDLLQNQDETDVDCGGLCSPCAIGKKCVNDSNCDSDYCDLQAKICTDSKKRDSDNDGIPDYWEIDHGLNPNDAADAALDSDKDGLNNAQEYKYNTDPDKADTDGDGANDGLEIQKGTDPLDPKSKPGLPLLLIIGIIVLLLLIASLVLYLLKLRKPAAAFGKAPLYGPQPPLLKVKKLPSMQETPRQISPEEKIAMHKRFLERTKEKRKRTYSVFEHFTVPLEQKPASGAVTTEKIEKPAPEPAKKEVKPQIIEKASEKEEIPEGVREWLEISEAKHKPKTLAEKSRSKNVFEKLEEFTEKESKPKSTEAIKRLSEATKQFRKKVRK